MLHLEKSMRFESMGEDFFSDLKVLFNDTLSINSYGPIKGQGALNIDVVVQEQSHC